MTTTASTCFARTRGTTARSALRAAARAACRLAAARPPPGRMKLRSAGSRASRASSQASSCATDAWGNAARATLESLPLHRGVAMALPKSSRRDWTSVSWSVGEAPVSQRRSAAPGGAAARTCPSSSWTGTCAQCSRARPSCGSAKAGSQSCRVTCVGPARLAAPGCSTRPRLPGPRMWRHPWRAARQCTGLTPQCRRCGCRWSSCVPASSVSQASRRTSRAETEAQGSKLCALGGLGVA